MKGITQFLNNNGFLFKKFNIIEPSSLHTRKKITIIDSCDIKNNLISIYIIESKSRFLVKNVDEIKVINERLKEFKKHNFKKTLIVISSPLCSKAKAYMKSLKWKVYDNFN